MIKIRENEYKLEKGDFISIHWDEPDGTWGFAYDQRYKGRNDKGEYVFESPIYGWNYLLTADKTKLSPGTYNENDREWFPVSNSTGWLRYLPD